MLELEKSLPPLPGRGPPSKYEFAGIESAPRDTYNTYGGGHTMNATPGAKIGCDGVGMACCAVHV